MRFIFGPLIIVVGVALMKYSYWVTQQTGKIDFAERFFPAPLSGTYTWWKLVGLAFIVIALAWMGGFLTFGTGSDTTVEIGLNSVVQTKTILKI